MCAAASRMLETSPACYLSPHIMVWPRDPEIPSLIENFSLGDISMTSYSPCYGAWRVLFCFVLFFGGGGGGGKRAFLKGVSCPTGTHRSSLLLTEITTQPCRKESVPRCFASENRFVCVSFYFKVLSTMVLRCLYLSPGESLVFFLVGRREGCKYFSLKSQTKTSAFGPGVFLTGGWLI